MNDGGQDIEEEDGNGITELMTLDSLELTSIEPTTSARNPHEETAKKPTRIVKKSKATMQREAKRIALLQAS